MTSSLTEKLNALKTSDPIPVNFRAWWNELGEESKKSVLSALTDEKLKNFTLLKIFREEGMHVSKDTFTEFRRRIWNDPSILERLDNE